MPGPPASGQIRHSGRVAAGTGFETKFFVVDSGKPGPTVFIQGSVHGNEPAGARAAGQIRHWKVNRGKLVVLPEANRPALERNTRYIPGVRESLRDLNRNFPRTEKEAARGVAAGAVWDLVKEVSPAWVVDLREGADTHRTNPGSTGGTLVFFPDPETRKAVFRMQEAVNGTLPREEGKFMLKRYPSRGSLARAAADRLGARAVVLVTTRKDPLSLRVRQHRLMAHRLLEHLAMVDRCTLEEPPGVDVLFGPRPERGRKIRVALYDASGTNKGPAALDRALKGVVDMEVHRVGPPEIRGGALSQFDVLIQPGGKSRHQSRALGERGRAAIRAFVRAGGGYVGFCAGTYLASCGAKRFLGILDARLVDVRHRVRGRGMVKIRMTAAGRGILGAGADPIEIRYANGPLLAPARRDAVPDFEVLAVYQSEVVRNGADKGVMQGTPAVVAGRFGTGRVVCFSPHPEYTGGLAYLIHRALRHAGGG